MNSSYAKIYSFFICKMFYEFLFPNNDSAYAKTAVDPYPQLLLAPALAIP
jgi:hypothetical protein